MKKLLFGHIILISSQSVFAFLLNDECFAEKQHILIHCLWFDPIELKPTIYHTRDEHANYYTIDDISNVNGITDINKQ